MTKAEMEADRNAYQALIANARRAEEQGLYRELLNFVKASWQHVDGMMRFEEKYADREFKSVLAIDLVLRFAPLMLDTKSLHELAAFLKKNKRIDKKATDDLAGAAKAALSRIWDNHRLWSHIERHGEVRQDELRQYLGGSQDYWREVAESWERMSLLNRVPDGGSYVISFATRLGQVIHGKCPNCGATVEAPKAMLLERCKCPRCRDSNHFVLLVVTKA